MALLVVPPNDVEPWPSLGAELCEFIEETVIYGPGSLKGQPYKIDPQFRAFLYRAYELYPRGHAQEGRRRFKRAGLSVRKGLAKTEQLAAICFAELHPEGPVRFDGWDADGDPVGKPVADPYIPMLSVTVEQVEELGYGALKVMCEEGPEADCFDVSLERIIRLDDRGRADGKAVPLANSPGARDGARTTLNAFDEPHRLYLPRQREAHATMDANLPKRPMEDPWSLYVGTAGQPGQNSIAEDLHTDALAIRDGKNKDPRLFYVYRWADAKRDMDVKAERLLAIEEATGPAGEFAPGQFEDIAEKWDRHGADKGFLERVWLNRWTKSDEQAFDVNAWGRLARPGTIAPGSLVTAGFDGARRKDSTAIVITEVATGTQEVWALWERDPDVPDWEIDDAEVDQAVADLFRVMDVWRMFCDPPYWIENVGRWAGLHQGKVEEWWTDRLRPMAQKVRAYREAIGSGAVGWSEGHRDAEAFARHIAAAGKRELRGIVDDDDEPLFTLQKIHPDRKFDAAMAAVLSWAAYLLALKKGAEPSKPAWAPRRLR